MIDDFFTALAEFSVQVGTGMLRKALDDSDQKVEIDKRAAADGILQSSVEQAAQIVHEFGLIGQLNDERGDFGKIVGIIAREQVGLVRVLTGVEVDIFEDRSKDAGEMCMRAVLALRSGETP